MTVFWIVMVPLAIYTGWVSSVIFISMISIYALAIGHFSSWRSTRVRYDRKRLKPNVIKSRKRASKEAG
jgi:hypothetical protein